MCRKRKSSLKPEHLKVAREIIFANGNKIQFLPEQEELLRGCDELSANPFPYLMLGDLVRDPQSEAYRRRIKAFVREGFYGPELP